MRLIKRTRTDSDKGFRHIMRHCQKLRQNILPQFFSKVVYCIGAYNAWTTEPGLVGYQTNEFASGQPYTVTLFWRPRHEIVADVQMVVQLLDRGGAKVAAVHDWPLREAYRVRAWRPHETMPLSYRFEIPPDLRPGPYLLIAGPYDLMQQRRIPTLDGQEYARVTTVKIPLPPSRTRPALRPVYLSSTAGRTVSMISRSMSPARIRADPIKPNTLNKRTHGRVSRKTETIGDAEVRSSR